MLKLPEHTYYKTHTGVVLSAPKSTTRIIEVLDHNALILDWFSEENKDVPIKDIVDGSYNWPVAWMDDGKVTEDLVWQYDGDPDTPPLFVIHHETEVFVMYKYGICSIVKADGTHIWGRVD